MMQATTTTRRFDPRNIKQAALAVGLFTSLAIGVTTATIVRDTSEPDNATVPLASAATTRNEMYDYAFIEQNLNLPTADAVRAADNHVNYAFMEQNLYLPGDSSQPETLSYDAIRFREMNELPNAIAPAAPNWRILEINSWGEDFTFATPGDDGVAPHPSDVPQQLSGEVRY